MKLLIAVVDYPNLEGGKQLAYVRTRNLWYVQHGIDVEVLNFSAKSDYIIDNIPVFSLTSIRERLKTEHYDLLVCHAANVRNHYRFLRRYGDAFPKIVFFYHGHEVLKLSQTYPSPYPYMGRSLVKEKLQDLYDEFKFKVWHNYIKAHYLKLYFVFVSQWMRDEFVKWVKPSQAWLEGRSFITYNCISQPFELHSYSPDKEKKYDFITIRALMDGRKYSVDIVNELAALNPDRSFLLIGKGHFFQHYKKAPNVHWIDTRLEQSEMLSLIDQSACALMPTRTDAQGVMSCELATYGIPLITSDLPVCHEVFEGFNNVAFIDNDHIDQADIVALSEQLSRLPMVKNPKYFMANTCDKEMEILHQVAASK